MEYRQLGNSDLKVSALSLGTMTFGEQNSETEAHAQLDLATTHGVNFIDTAEMYPVAPRAETQGLTERYIGSWLKHQRRDQLIIASKIAGPARGFSWIRNGPRINKAHLNAAIDSSLKRLQTDYLDLYQIHWPDRYVPMFGATSYEASQEHETTPIAEQLLALSELVKAGKIRHIGLSNETPWGVAEFVRCAEQMGLPKVISIQNAYHLMNRTFESGLAEVCHHAHIGLLAYSPLAFGHLSGKYIAAPKAAGRITLFPGFGQRYNKINVPVACAAYVQIAMQAGLNPAQMALAYARTRWFTASVILGATTHSQLLNNLASTELTLPAEVIDQIDAIHKQYPNPAP
ncbi:MAG TPA: NADP(H)-dependent aldo-keto reductase [Gallionella sp.]|jgi:aryl-alcohol dehydrogenase-like predicted oxidoreductase|nr:NADP(H)-dependent aldo-keto reductase [Gallionella sp.]OGS67385.1 MAG: aldo/keto reductase [Gallionellales bacterium GWA2_54_124]HCI52203.1 NADP(H)-dependent aldo-keto reductase [Gallionella sp.]